MPSRPVVSEKWIEPSRITVTVAMPECGCHRYSMGVLFSPSAKTAWSRKTKGLMR
jgi:hypothetical protein